MSKIILIGGAGFVGRNFSKYFADNGFDITIIDNFGGCDSHIVPVSNYKYIRKSCSEINAVDLQDTDTVIHLASKTEYWPTPSEYIRNNCFEISKLFEEDKFPKWCKFILISSQSVYGKSHQPWNGNTIIQPTDQYGLTKSFQEQITQMFCKPRFAIIRPSIILGPGISGKNLHSGLIRYTVARLNAGMNPIAYGDGEQTRCFVNVFDLAELIRNGSILNSVPINATSNEGALTINFIIDRIQSIMNTNLEVIRNKYERSGDTQIRDGACQVDYPAYFGPAITGKILEEYIISLIKSGLPTKEEIEAVDKKNLELGMVREIG